MNEWYERNYVLYVMFYDMCYMKIICVVCNTIIYNDACYSHGMTFLTQFGKFTNFPNLYFESLQTWLQKIMSLGNSCSFSCMSFVCACIYPYLVQVCANPIHLYYFRCRHWWVIEIQVHYCSYSDISIHPEFGRSSCFRGCYCFSF